MVSARVHGLGREAFRERVQRPEELQAYAGCISFPPRKTQIKRSSRTTLKAQKENNKRHTKGREAKETHSN